MLVEQMFLKPGRYKGIDLTAQDLEEYAAGTNRAIKLGVAIPVIERHAAPGLGEDYYSQFATEADSALTTKGWLQGVKVNSDGSLSYTLDITDPDVAKAINNKSIKYTSPELRENYVTGSDEPIGRVFRHVALTATPRNRNQSEFTAVEPAAMQFSLDDYEATTFADDDDSVKGEAGEDTGGGVREELNRLLDSGMSAAEIGRLTNRDESTIQAIASGKIENPPAALLKTLKDLKSKKSKETTQMADDDKEKDEKDKKPEFLDESASETADDKIEDTPGPDNPDMPQNTDADPEMEAIIGNLAALGIELPAELNLADPASRQALLAALKTKVAADAANKTETEPKEEEEVVAVSSAPNSQFSEDVIKEASPVEAAMMKEINSHKEKITQFSDERATLKTEAVNEKHRQEIQSANISKPVKEALLAKIGTVQFSDGDEKPTFSMDDMIQLAKDSTPKGMQFSDDPKTVDNLSFLEGEDAVSAEAAVETNKQLNKVAGYQTKPEPQLAQ